jgi:ribosomal protein L11 methyltransferase
VGSLWQLSFDLGGLDPARVEESCFAAGATSVTFVDARDNPVLEPLPGEFRLWPNTRLRALFAAGPDPLAVVHSVTNTLDIPMESVAVERVEDRIWEREWLRDFHAMRFGRRLWVCPHHEEAPDPAAIVVRLDPGLAFGTGTHPSTALCLEWLDGQDLVGRRVIDFGCGSGILAIAAVKLGAASAHCFDIDPQALTATADNAQSNEIQSRIVPCANAESLPKQVDVLVANILSGPLCELAPRFQGLVRPGGCIVLAGLMHADVPDVTQAYGAWFDIAPFADRGDWVGLAGKRLLHASKRTE